MRHAKLTAAALLAAALTAPFAAAAPALAQDAPATYDGCQTYYPEGAVITLATAAEDADCWASDDLNKTDASGRPMRFLGWSERRVDDVTTKAELDAAGVVTQVTMPKGGKIVYAVWGSIPTLTYDVNQPDDSLTANPTPPPAPEPGSVENIGDPVSDTSGWTAGDTSKLKGWRFDGWYTRRDGGDDYWADGDPALDAPTTVYAHWTRLEANVVYDANGGSGSHDPTPGWQWDGAEAAKDLDGSFHRLGWTLTGWNTRPDGSGVAYEPGDRVPLEASDVTLYAQWTPLLDTLPGTGGDGVASHGPLVAGLAGLGVAVMAGGGAWAVRRRHARPAGSHGR